jgi:hypothetical protein
MVEAMSVKELKAFLSERGVSLVGVTEKSELLALARTAHEQDSNSAEKVPFPPALGGCGLRRTASDTTLMR